MERPGRPKAVSGKEMLLVIAALVAAILALAWLAGPFGREPVLKQQPMAHWPSSEPSPEPQTRTRAPKAKLLTWVKVGPSGNAQ
jgi:hypothetical protein